MENKTICNRKNCRLRTGLEKPESEQDFSYDYPYSVYGDSCVITDCKIRD